MLQRIFKLEDDQGVVVGDDCLKRHITNYYKNLFGQPEASGVSLFEDQVLDIPQVSQEENESLIATFTESEVRNAVFQMEHNKALCPDGFPAEFYQVFWGIIKVDLLPLFADLHREALDLHNMNFGIITLIPKIHNATKIQHYRPICVLNVSFRSLLKWEQTGLIL
jgi:hypothetical protein